MFKRTVWKDQRGRLHNEKGQFTKIPRIPSNQPLSQEQVSRLESEELYFYQEDDSPQTYIRTGTFIEVEMDDDDLFAEIMSWTMIIGTIGIFINRLF